MIFSSDWSLNIHVLIREDRIVLSYSLNRSFKTPTFHHQSRLHLQLSCSNCWWTISGEYGFYIPLCMHVSMIVSTLGYWMWTIDPDSIHPIFNNISHNTAVSCFCRSSVVCLSTHITAQQVDVHWPWYFYLDFAHYSVITFCGQVAIRINTRSIIKQTIGCMLRDFIHVAMTLHFYKYSELST